MRRLHIAILLVSIALISFEVSLMQVLSFVQWHHFAAMIISIALLGFGASGALISLARDWMLDRFDRLIPWLLALCAVAIAAAVPLSQFPAARFDSYLIFVDSAHALALLLTYLIFLIPFFLGALVIGLSFVKYTQDVGRLYFWNLLGSGLGAIFPIVLMWSVEPTALAPLCALPAAGGALLTSGRTSSRTARPAAALALAICIGLALYPTTLEPSQFKDISRALDLPEARVTYRQASPLGLIQVVTTPVTRHAPGLSLNFRGLIPVQDLAFVNGDAVGAVGSWTPGDSVHVLDFTSRALPFEVAPRKRVLILESGAGETISHALFRGAEQVVAVESILALTAVLRSDSTSVLNHANVSVHGVESRSFLRSDSGTHDLIILPTVGRFGGTIGLRETEENFLMTVEALDEMWESLDNDGVIAITAWMDYPYRHPLRVMSLFTELLRRKGLDPEHHLVAVRSWTDVTFITGRQAFTIAAQRRVRAFSRAMGFDPLLLPGLAHDERNAFNELQDTSFFASIDAIGGSDWADFVGDYAFHIEAPTDDRPYFSSFLRWSSIAEISNQFGGEVMPFFGLGLFIALLTLVQATVLSVIFIVLPLFRIRAQGRALARTLASTLVYFAALGVGFMFIEIVLIQRFILFLGRPVYAVSAVLGVILIGSGIGAYRSSSLPADGKTVTRAAVVVSVLAVAYSILLEPLFSVSIGFPLTGRAIVASILLLPVAVAMGYPFPLGLRMVAAKAENQVPWAWGVNGCLSVVGAAAAPLISIEFGFTVLLISAAAVYTVAAIVIRKHS